jgi:hypothetical protein
MSKTDAARAQAPAPTPDPAPETPRQTRIAWALPRPLGELEQA